MSLNGTKQDADGILGLVRATADGFGQLLADHIKLARLELVADVKAYGRQVAVIAMLVPFLLIGYSFLFVGLALVLARWLGPAGAFFAVGGAHVVVGGAVVLAAVARLRAGRAPMQESANEVDRSVNALVAITTNNNNSGAGERNGLVGIATTPELARRPRGI